MSADPVQLLDRLSPPEGWDERTDIDADPVAAAILERVLADDDTNVVSLDAARRRRRRGIGGAIVVAALMTGGAIAAFLDREPEETRRVTCWSESVDPPAQRAAVSWDGTTEPLDECADVWAAGTFGGSAEPVGLQACVTAQSSVAVVPGEPGICGSLGLAEYSGAPAEGALSLNQAANELTRRFNPATCESVEVAEREIPRILAEYGFSGWTVKIVGTFSDDEPCATVTLETGAVAVVAPVPPPP